MFIVAVAPRFEAASIRVERELVGTEEGPLNEPAVARCLLDHAVVHFARPYKEKCMIFSLETPMHPSA
jgi:hypothetical protein